MALPLAAKSAIDFNSQISAIGPLLTNGGKITASVRSELDQMSSSSKKWAMQFGVSTDKINDGMTEMVKRGYTAQQTMGAMPAVLNVAKASGDDFNDVMHVSTSVLEQFGLKTTSTTGMLQNTSRVTDSLTYVANATAAGFQDMGEAMTYVGPSAHAAGISLEETAIAIGIMSNKGIEGSVAGTALRGALTRLMKPSKQNVAGFEAMGVSVEDFKKGTLTLPEIIDKIKTNTAGWTDQQRASSIAMAFGTEAQAGMNALISEGGDELRKYTKGAEDSAGTTKKIADQLNDTQASKSCAI
ncbi:phage tail tape measure protein [Latilactobacillus sakei]